MFPLQLIRKDGDFQAPRLLDEKDMRANEDMQMKKKNRKSGTPCKVREQDGRGGKVSGTKPKKVALTSTGQVCFFLFFLVKKKKKDPRLQLCLFKYQSEPW